MLIVQAYKVFKTLNEGIIQQNYISFNLGCVLLNFCSNIMLK